MNDINQLDCIGPCSNCGIYTDLQWDTATDMPIFTCDDCQ